MGISLVVLSVLQIKRIRKNVNDRLNAKDNPLQTATPDYSAAVLKNHPKAEAKTNVGDKKKGIIFSSLIIALLVALFYFTSISFKVSSGNLKGTAWWDPGTSMGQMGETIYFNGDKAVVSVWAADAMGNGSNYPGSKYATKISRVEYDYSYDSKTQTGTIERGTFYIEYDEQLKKYIIHYQGGHYLYHSDL